MGSNASLRPYLNPASLQPNSILEEVPDYTIKHVHGEKDEVYSLGITLLSASSNNPISEFYDYKQMDINRAMIEKKIALMHQHKYHPQLVQLVQAMLQENPEKRISLAQIMSTVSQPKKELTKNDIFELPANTQTKPTKVVNSDPVRESNNQRPILASNATSSVNPQRIQNRQLNSIAPQPVESDLFQNPNQTNEHDQAHFRLPKMEAVSNIHPETHLAEDNYMENNLGQEYYNVNQIDHAQAKQYPPQNSQLATPRGNNTGFLNSNPNSNKLREPQTMVNNSSAYIGNTKNFPLQSGLKNMQQANSRFY
jgi:hypothetical protein